jgi:two-component system cell cycle response regulator CtrA
MRILAVDNEEAYLRAIEVMLGAEKFNVYGIDSADEAVSLGKLYDYDLIVLSLPEQVDVIRALRTAKIQTPILAISRNGEIDVMVRTLDAGADDYMTKPFHKDELVARIHALVRRSKGLAESVVTVGDIAVNLSTRRVSVSGEPIYLTGKEFQMMELLALRKGMTLSKEQFLNHVYGGMDEPELKIIDVFMCKLRKKLPPGTITTVWGRGYLLGERQGDISASDLRDISASDLRDLSGVAFDSARLSNGMVPRRGAA